MKAYNKGKWGSKTRVDHFPWNGELFSLQTNFLTGLEELLHFSPGDIFMYIENQFAKGTSYVSKIRISSTKAIWEIINCLSKSRAVFTPMIRIRIELLTYVWGGRMSILKMLGEKCFCECLLSNSKLDLLSVFHVVYLYFVMFCDITLNRMQTLPKVRYTRFSLPFVDQEIKSRACEWRSRRGIRRLCFAIVAHTSASAATLK